jgi:Protein of unknown function (DUF998)
MTPALGIPAALGTLACAAFLIRVHLLPTGYQPVSNAVSDYGVGDYRGYYRWQTAASAYAALLLAAAIARTTHPVPQLLVFLLLTFAVARLLIPSFPTDLDRSRPTATGRIHTLLAGAAFAAIAWCAAALPDRVDWPSLHGPLVVLGWIVVVTAVACGLAMTSLLHRVTEPFFGALERLFYAATLAWLLVVSLHFV